MSAARQSTDAGAILVLDNVSKRFARRVGPGAAISRWWSGADRADVRAVDGVSLALGRDEVLGLVGESGCGKSTIGRLAAGLIMPSAGRVTSSPGECQPGPMRGAASPQLRVQLVFQNPHDSLNPRHKVSRIIGEPAHVHGLVSSGNLNDYVDRLMGSVGLHADLRNRRPHELSGGQCQRVGIARALSVRPDVLVCDEPISALDVSIQAQVLNLFLDLKEQRALSYLFISHDLSVVARISDRVAVMYLGRVVELAKTPRLFAMPNHPYTKALLESAPRIDQRRRKFMPIMGDVPSPSSPPTGCHFHPRCPHAHDRCVSERPALKAIAAGHWSACHLNDHK